MTTHNLPQQATPFVGRHRELTEIAALLSDPACRLLTLLGAGGIGKTRLALQAASEQFPYFSDGVFFVSLAPVASPDLIASAVASALRIPLNNPEDVQPIVRYLHEQYILLLLDNFEHLLDGVGLLPDILQDTPNVKFLVTSRERLNVQEEWVLALDGLRVPDDEAAEPLGNYSAVQLFVQRARQVQTNFSLNDNAEAVKTICQRVEGMPLGLELAVSWLRAMSCTQIATQMSSSIDFLTTPHRNVPERHRSLRAVFEHSWKLLSATEQQVLTQLSVFRGGFDREAAEQVAGATLPLLAGLVDKSLIRLNVDGRYDLHELLRQYAAHSLNADETHIAMQRHFDYFLMLAEQAEAHNFGYEQIAWFDRMEVEFDNLRTALAWSLQNEEAETGLRLVATLRWFFSERSHWAEGFNWLERMLVANPNAPTSLRAKALHSAAALTSPLGGDQRTRVLGENALVLAREVNDPWNIAWALSHIAMMVENNLEQKGRLMEESLALFRELGDEMGIAHSLIRRAWIALEQQDYSYVDALVREAALRAGEAGDKIMSAWVIYVQGQVAWYKDHDLIQANICFERTLSLFREVRYRIGIGSGFILLEAAGQTTINMEYAQMLNEAALTWLREIKPAHPNLSLVLAGLASIARTRGQFERAATLLGAGNRSALAAKRDMTEIVTFENDKVILRTQLGETAFDEAWAAGKAMTPEQVIVYALDDKDTLNEATPVENSAGNRLSLEPLSARELEILRLVAKGLTNAEIAQKLFLAVGTVKVHTSNIYSKLGVNSRTQAVVEANRLALI